MPYRITGVAPDAPKSETRQRAASALVLAMKWVEQGTARVRIEIDGRAYDTGQFREAFLPPRPSGS